MPSQATVAPHGTATVVAESAVVTEWTGRSAAALQQAARLTNEAFAEYLGVHVRTVAYWRARPDTRPTPTMQGILDTALERATDAQRARFGLLLAGGAR